MLLCHFTFLRLVDPIIIHYALRQIAKIFCLKTTESTSLATHDIPFYAV